MFFLLTVPSIFACIFFFPLHCCRFWIVGNDLLFHLPHCKLGIGKLVSWWEMIPKCFCCLVNGTVVLHYSLWRVWSYLPVTLFGKLCIWLPNQHVWRLPNLNFTSSCIFHYVFLLCVLVGVIFHHPIWLIIINACRFSISFLT